jgi:hypothetical protein
MTGIELTAFEMKVTWAVALAVLILVIGFLAFHRGRHVQSNFDRRVDARARRRFTMAQTIEYGQSATYRIRAFGQSGREMSPPTNPSAVATPPEIVDIEFSPDGQHLRVTNKNQTDLDINVVVAVSAGGFAVSKDFVFLPEHVAALTLEMVEEPAEKQQM